MNAKKNSLGRGLGALIEDANLPNEMVEAVEAGSEIDIHTIDVNPYQPRQDFDQDALNELAASIKQLGIIQPLTLRRLPKGRFQIIAGERRFRAAKIAGLLTVPAFIRSADDQEMLELALVENIQRADLNAIEVAISYQRLIDECNLTQETLGDRVGKKRTTVTNYLRLLKLPAEIQNGLRHDELTMGHARAMVTIDDKQKQINIFTRIIDEGLSVREVEELVRHVNDPEPELRPLNKFASKSGSNNDIDQEYEELRHHLSKHFNSQIEFKRNPRGVGKIIISFKSDEDLERILAVMDTKVNA